MDERRDLVDRKELGVRSIGVEAEARWCDVIASRVAQDSLFGAAS